MGGIRYSHFNLKIATVGCQEVHEIIRKQLHDSK